MGCILSVDSVKPAKPTLDDITHVWDHIRVESFDSCYPKQMLNTRFRIEDIQYQGQYFDRMQILACDRDCEVPLAQPFSNMIIDFRKIHKILLYSRFRFGSKNEMFIVSKEGYISCCRDVNTHYYTAVPSFPKGTVVHYQNRSGIVKYTVGAYFVGTVDNDYEGMFDDKLVKWNGVSKLSNTYFVLNQPYDTLIWTIEQVQLLVLFIRTLIDAMKVKFSRNFHSNTLITTPYDHRIIEEFLEYLDIEKTMGQSELKQKIKTELNYFLQRFIHNRSQKYQENTQTEEVEDVEGQPKRTS